ncbi:transcriptional regulator [Cellulomonas wangsupingiae]|uniref:Transcriptional regulator n=1 Tax=Cellulomonas wangsupingiae TaxID=2968085 RepID=A0ABY5K598_9CELL|nr:transcriptional regulator [Cellulomonas wangsupingiae]MCC2336169.1 transcriptional regulator [Cellulomonas wangsupingiae]UUI64586.1 transcriptional regulator [Cellulomonas wangsupingiae]
MSPDPAGAPDRTTAADAGSFDEIVHAPVRLRVCGMLAAADEVEFSVVRDAVGVSDATLSKHLRVLTEAGYAEARKAASRSRDDARRLTWLRLTLAGRRAFSRHVAALRAIAEGVVG